MTSFVVNSDIPANMKSGIEVWIKGVPTLLRNEGITNVRLRTAYCCTPDSKIIAEFEGPDKETLRSALNKIKMPFTAVMEATKVE
jgi:hypothetical protein